MATNFLDLATTLEYLGAKCLLKKKVNFVPCMSGCSRRSSLKFVIGCAKPNHNSGQRFHLLPFDNETS